MRGAEAHGRQAGVYLGEGVVVVCYVELAGVFGGVVVGMADEGAFPLRTSLALSLLCELLGTYVIVELIP